jgi:hypothetical protein
MVTAVLLAAAGCGRSSSGPSATPVVAKPTPEASFDLIVATIKRRIEDTPSGFVAQQPGGHSRMMASNKVTSQLLPPAKEGEPYRAEVTVVSQSRYWLRRATEESEDSSGKSDERNEQRPSKGTLENPANIGVDALDSESIVSSGGESQSRRASPGQAESTVTRRDDEEKRTFELEYKGGRWILLTKPTDTERAIALAFEEALGTQI